MCIIKLSKFGDYRGTSLLLGILVMTGIIAIGLAMAGIIISELKLSKNIDEATIAYYAAETGIEKSLHRVKTGRHDNDTLGKVMDDIRSDEMTFSSNNASWSTSESTSAESSIKVNLKQDQSTQIDLYDPDSGATIDVESVYIIWSERNCSTPGASWVEASFISWQTGLAWGEESSKVEKRMLSEGTILNDPNPQKPYRLRVRALYCDIDNLEIKAYKHDNPNVEIDDPLGIPSRIFIKSIGSFGTKTEQAITASMPWKLPLMGVADFDIFSGGDIEK
jgi:hypothetical protein